MSLLSFVRRKLRNRFGRSNEKVRASVDTRANAMLPIQSCACCGSARLQVSEVMWQALSDEWRLANYETGYINRQQGLYCLDCKANLRSMALAVAIMRCFGFHGLFADFVRQPLANKLRVLEINEAGNLTPFLSKLDHHTLGVYPNVNMMSLPYTDGSFDLVLHSDTLEHIEHPVRALSECCRVLKPGGFCCFTIPIVVDRLTVSRQGLSPSYHGNSAHREADWAVQTEYGCDAWKHIIQAGFQECRIYSLEYPAAQAFVGARFE